MQSAVELRTLAHGEGRAERRRVFVAIVVLCTVAAAAFASWLPLQVSIVTVFLFAGPHNWFELRYFLMRLPVRFGRSRNFFLTAFAGLGVADTRLRFAAVYLQRGDCGVKTRGPSSLRRGTRCYWFGSALLVWLRGKQKTRANWTWTDSRGVSRCVR